MENAGSILLALFAGLAAAYFGYRISQERERMRELVGLLGENDAGLILSLENMVHGGRLSPVAT